MREIAGFEGLELYDGKLSRAVVGGKGLHGPALYRRALKMNVGLIGDFDASVTAHKAIPLALKLASEKISSAVEFQWLNSDTFKLSSLPEFDALWCVPASPYEDTDKVLRAIRFARENDVPFLGTCGGYQHAALEFAQNVLRYSEADNVEINPGAPMPLISGLVCKLYDEKAQIDLVEGSNIATIYGAAKIFEEYICGYGVNREYLHIFENSDMCFTGFDEDGDPRSLEIPGNRFFVGTAFQPERSAFEGLPHPLVCEYLIATTKNS